MHTRVPKYRNHKASGQAIVEINGRHFYLGKYDSPESHEKYRQKIAAYLYQKEVNEEPVSSLSIDRLILKYFKFAKTYYLKNGKPTDEITSLRIVMRRLTNAENAFSLLFSSTALPSPDLCLKWVRKEADGNVYNWADENLEGWLCPALLKYFESAPAELYVQLKNAC